VVLPGKMAKETRVKFADVLTMAGDQSRIGEINLIWCPIMGSKPIGRQRFTRRYFF